MPEYSFKCGKCGESFSLTMSISDYEDAQVKCPKCGSDQVERVFDSFYAQTSKKS